VSEVSQELSPQEPAVQPGDHVVLRKPHPCGGTEWEVTRVGADIGLRCLICNRVLMLPRHEFRTKLRHIVRAAGK
jgi:hypothetical protein